MGTVVLTGGGTGGHVYPAIAIGDVLHKRGHTVLYYGDAERLEARVAPQRGYDFYGIPAPRYPRGSLWKKGWFALRLLAAGWRVRGMLRQHKVDVVLGVGGYISAPTLLGATLMGARRIIHEANVVPGAANRLMARVADTILLTYEGTRSRLNSRAPMHLVGVPVNPDILGGTREEAASRYGLDPDVPTVLFVGGSLGAATLNALAMACALRPDREYQVLHLCGRKYHGDVLAELGEVPGGVRVVDYEDRMMDAYAMADLVVCRTGSSTLGELCAVGGAGLLIPSANVTDNHQEENARGLESVGAGVVLVERDWDTQAAALLVEELLSDPARREELSACARAQARMDSAMLAADHVEALMGGR